MKSDLNYTPIAESTPLNIDTIRRYNLLARYNSFDDFIEKSLEWASTVLPFEGLSLLLADSKKMNLFGYKARGIFAEEDIRQQFRFDFTQPTNKGRRFFAKEAVIGLQHPDTYEGLHGCQLRGKAFGPIIPSNDSVAFVVPNVLEVSSANNIALLDVYSSGVRLDNFFAFPLYSPGGDRGESANGRRLIGILIGNNIEENGEDELDKSLRTSEGIQESSSEKAITTIAESYLRVVEIGVQISGMIAFAIHGVRLGYQISKTSKIFKKVTATLGQIHSKLELEEEDSKRSAISIVSHLLFTEFRSSHGAAFLIRGSQIIEEMVWESSDGVAKNLSEVIEFGGISDGVLRNKVALVGRDKDVLMIELYEDVGGKVMLLLHKEPKKLRESDMTGEYSSTHFLIEDQEVAEQIMGQINYWIRLAITRHQSLRERKRVWKLISSQRIHRLKTPLATIKQSLKLMRKDSRRSEHGRLDMLLKEVTSLFGMVNALMKFTTSDNISIDRVSLKEFMRRTFHMLGAEDRKIFRGRVKIKTNQSTTLNVQVSRKIVWLYIDTEELATAVVELIHNATHHGSGETIDLELKIMDRSERSNGLSTFAFIDSEHEEMVPCLSIAVSNRGRIAESVMRESRLFQPYVTSSGEGNGLGLPYVAEVAKGHGGYIEYGYLEEQGISEFKLHIPQKWPTGGRQEKQKNVSHHSGG